MPDTMEKELEKQLEPIKKQLEQLEAYILRFRSEQLEADLEEKKSLLEEKRLDIRSSINSNILVRTSDYMLYFSIFVSATVGVLGNFFVSLWFQPNRPEYVAGLWLSSILLLASFGLIVYEMRKARKNLEKEWKRITKLLVENPKMLAEVYGLKIEGVRPRRRFWRRK
ncbi:MAG: hypothetical protein WCC63_04405 [Candidatus Bathyarchaeia archaeon]